MSNVQACGVQAKVECIEGDFVEWLKGQDTNCFTRSLLIIDPPWGGSGYKYEDSIPELYLFDKRGLYFLLSYFFYLMYLFYF